MKAEIRKSNNHKCSKCLKKVKYGDNLFIFTCYHGYLQLCKSCAPNVLDFLTTKIKLFIFEDLK